MIEVTKRTGGSTYVEIIQGEGHGRAQKLLDGASFAALKDAEGMLPPGTRVAADGTAVVDDTKPVYGFTPAAQSVPADGVDFFSALILSGPIKRSALQDNLGRALTAPEIAQIPDRFILV